jgi:hypothetical protein
MTDAGAYHEFAERLQASGVIADPWVDGKPRFRAEPLLVRAGERDALYHAAEAVAAVLDEMCRIVAGDPGLLDDFFGLTQYQKLLWLAQAPHWHGIARADVFFTDDGLAVCEVNSDTPSGQAEAVLTSALALPEHPGCEDPNAALEERFCRMLAAVAAATTGATPPLSVGMVYPTELTEDLAMIQLYRRWCMARGWRMTLGSPYNLRPARGGGADARDGVDGRRRGGVALLAEPCDLIVRHYKTDWWCERLPVWKDEAEYPDPEPLEGPLGVLLGGVLGGACAVVNPLGAVLTQNKRSFAFLWEALGRFPAWAQEAIRRYVPYTVRLETLLPERLHAERADWVLKSDYGCEGEEVILGAECTDAVWEESIAQAAERRWVAQRYFRARGEPGGAAGETINYGVYLVAGRASGLLCRVQRGRTDHHAVIPPTLVVRDEGESA